MPEIQFVGDSTKCATRRAKREEIRTIVERLSVEERLGLWQEAGGDNRQDFIRENEDGLRIVVRHAEDVLVVVVPSDRPDARCPLAGGGKVLRTA